MPILQRKNKGKKRLTTVQQIIRTNTRYNENLTHRPNAYANYAYPFEKFNKENDALIFFSVPLICISFQNDVTKFFVKPRRLVCTNREGGRQRKNKCYMFEKLYKNTRDRKFKAIRRRVSNYYEDDCYHNNMLKQHEGRRNKRNEEKKRRKSRALLLRKMDMEKDRTLDKSIDIVITKIYERMCTRWMNDNS